jgi:hypothetical protein
VDSDFKHIKDSLDSLLENVVELFPDDPLATLRLRIITLTLEFLNLMSEVEDGDFETQQKYIPLCSIICKLFTDFLVYERFLASDPNNIIGDDDSLDEDFDQFEDMLSLLKNWQVKAEA